jgi:hypothetical protein
MARLMTPFVYGIAAATALVCYLSLHSRNRTLALAVLIWFTLAILIDQIGVFPVTGSWVAGDLLRFVIFGALITLPIIGFLVLPVLAPQARTALSEVPLSGLAALQVYRFGGVAFFIAMEDGVMPVILALSAGLLDTFVALSSAVLALLLHHGKGRRMAIAWSFVGLTDFTVAILLVSVSIFGLLTLSPAPSAIGQSPFILISLFQLPLAVIVHIEILRRLWLARPGP